MEAIVIVEEDGTDKLCMALYGEVKIQKILGGSEAAMLYDAAAKIEKLELLVADLNVRLTKKYDPNPVESVPNNYDHYKEYSEALSNEDYLNNDPKLARALLSVQCRQCHSGTHHIINKTLNHPGLENGVMCMEVELGCNGCGGRQMIRLPIYEGEYIGAAVTTQITAGAYKSPYGHDTWSSLL